MEIPTPTASKLAIFAIPVRRPLASSELKQLLADPAVVSVLTVEGATFQQWDASSRCLEFSSLETSTDKIKAVVLAFLYEQTQHKYPEGWVQHNGAPWTPDDDDDAGPLLVEGTAKELEFCRKAFSAGGASTPLKRVQRVQNPLLWIKYAHASALVAKNGPLNEQWLFHGTRQTDPLKVAASGIDFRYSEAGYFGRGSYFAERCSYSTNYEFRNTMGEKQMFLARVAAGKVDERGMARDGTIRMPSDGFDSIRGNVREPSDFAYVVYDIAQSYPAYLLTY
jgi:hypothetical protein